jgi:hypothetical protein
VGHLTSRYFKRFHRIFLGVGNDGCFTAHQLVMANVVSHGQTQHVTNDIEKMQVKEPYQGTKQVYTANGSGHGGASEEGETRLPP